MIATGVSVLLAAILLGAGDPSSDDPPEITTASENTAQEMNASENNADVSSASENNLLLPNGQVIEVDGVGTITQQDIDEIAAYTQQLTQSLSEKDPERPMVIEREPDMLMQYNNDYQMYHYMLPDGQWIECNVPQGAYCRGSVEFLTSENITCISYFKDGETMGGRGPFLENGTYEVIFWDLSVNGDADRAYRVDYCFTIYSDHTMNLSHIEAPANMEVTEVWYEGKPQEIRNPYHVHNLMDGSYHIVFEGGGAQYVMDYIRDTAPPVIEFTPAYEYGCEMHSEVNYTIKEQNAKLEIYRNYVLSELPRGYIPVNGAYRMIVTDPAGNYRKYEFTIKAPIPLFSKKLLWIPVALVAAALIAMLYFRRNMRVL